MKTKKEDTRAYQREVECPNCLETRRIYKYDTRVTNLCQACWFAQGANGKGDKATFWRGGVTWSSGYKFLYVTDNSPYAAMRRKRTNYVREHRLVMAAYLGRCLESWEVVHHINGVKHDNRIENLELLPQVKDHLPDMVLKSRLGELEKRVTQLEADNALLRAQIEGD